MGSPDADEESDREDRPDLDLALASAVLTRASRHASGPLVFQEQAATPQPQGGPVHGKRARETAW